MNFIKAIKEMKKGKKVNLEVWEVWTGSLYLFMKDGKIMIHWSNGPPSVYPLPNCEIESDNWEVVEEKKTEKKTLSDKISMLGNPHLFVRDVKPALKEFILFCDDRAGFSGTSIVRDKAEKIFGERLLE